MAKGFSNWLSPAFGAELELRPDLDQVEALAPEREALWTRLEAASFLTDDEKRAAAGYGTPLSALGDTPSSRRPPSAVKFNPYHDDAGRFTTADGGLTGPGHGLGGAGKPNASGDDGRVRVAQQATPRTRSGPLAQYPDATPAQIVRFGIASRDARDTLSQVQQLDPNWKPTPSLHENIEGAIAAAEAEAAQATARLGEIARQGIGGNIPPAETGTSSAARRLPHPGYDASIQPGTKPENLPDFLTRPIGGGTLTGDLRSLTPAERRFSEELRALGNHVEIIKAGEDQTPDFKINGVEHELKTVSNVKRTDADGLSKSISSTIGDARSQSSRVIIDARGQVGMTREAADQAVRRAFGADSSEKIKSITILTPQGPIYAARLP
jgi:Contact-dependent growth inhibition CdiA C-terminal domain